MACPCIRPNQTEVTQQKTIPEVRQSVQQGQRLFPTTPREEALSVVGVSLLALSTFRSCSGACEARQGTRWGWLSLG